MTAKEDFRTTEEVICDFINEENVKFVFPSTIAMETWTDWTIKNSSKTGCRAVALEKWLVWDAFKNEFAQVHDRQKSCIPETLRKLFVRTLIKENSRLVKAGKPSFLHPLINDQFADNSMHFTDWLAAILPSLSLWKSKFIKKNGGSAETSIEDDEDRVYNSLYDKYSEFLDRAKMFDPAWVELNDISQKYHFVIFHPEQLKDFNDYKEKIEQCNATLVRLPQNAEKPECLLYPNARMELRRTVLKIRELNAKQNVAWSDIALTVPNLSSYRSYIERELKNYCVPYAIRSGIPYTQNSAGRIFSEIDSCVKNDFNLETMRTILQDGFVPWQKPELNEKIVQVALESRSICSYTRNGARVDPLEEAFEDRIKQAENLEKEQSETSKELEILKGALERYKNLKSCLNSICMSKSFKTIKEEWHNFEAQFLTEDKVWPNDKDNIIGVCIAELSKYIAIEKEYASKLNLEIENPFDFFLEELNANIYTPQKPKNVCISVFDYRTAADAYFDYHFIINANQKDLTVPFKELSFLNEKKRKELGASDNEGASEAYIRLYAKTGREHAFFSSSTNSFDGFAIPHTFFIEKNILKASNPEDYNYIDSEDFFLNEKNYLLSEGSPKPAAITEQQKQSFLNWKEKQKNTQLDFTKSDILKEKAKQSLIYGSSEKQQISQTDLKNFFPCQRKWLFKKVLHLKEQNAGVELMGQFDFGNICHKIVELVFDTFAKDGKSLPDLSDKGKEAEVKSIVEDATERALTEKQEWIKPDDIKNSHLATEMLLAQKNIFTDYIMLFMKQICQPLKKMNDGKFAGFKVNSVEKSCKSNFNKNFDISGKIDCILSGNDEQGEVIIDYKTGTLPEKKNFYPNAKQVLNDFQMPFYYKLLKEQKNSRYDVQTGLFQSLKQEKQNDKKVFKKTYVLVPDSKDVKTAKEFEKDVLTLLDKYLEDFASDITNANFEPSCKTKNERQKVKIYVHCKKCDYKDICRTTFAVAKKDFNND